MTVCMGICQDHSSSHIYSYSYICIYGICRHGASRFDCYCKHFPNGHKLDAINCQMAVLGLLAKSAAVYVAGTWEDSYNLTSSVWFHVHIILSALMTAPVQRKMNC